MMNSTSASLINVFDNFITKREKSPEHLGPCKYILKCPYYSPKSSKCEVTDTNEECVIAQIIMSGFV